ncbi:hypothetical protein MSAN_00913600 [Mycena sanguinolenta]|uniref:Uncharacterized protein n=1 Tax=Mycena sanguinolenta TaxID=230812 RepID=A0A8H6YX62_9AGAR|nr:hypothetical protein MSAN_00913600 [Mycena sanguinolenta]
MLNPAPGTWLCTDVAVPPHRVSINARLPDCATPAPFCARLIRAVDVQLRHEDSSHRIDGRVSRPLARCPLDPLPRVGVTNSTRPKRQSQSPRPPWTHPPAWQTLTHVSTQRAIHRTSADALPPRSVRPYRRRHLCAFAKNGSTDESAITQPLVLTAALLANNPRHTPARRLQGFTTSLSRPAASPSLNPASPHAHAPLTAKPRPAFRTRLSVSSLLLTSQPAIETRPLCEEGVFASARIPLHGHTPRALARFPLDALPLAGDVLTSSHMCRTRDTHDANLSIVAPTERDWGCARKAPYAPHGAGSVCADAPRIQYVVLHDPD